MRSLEPKIVTIIQVENEKVMSDVESYCTVPITPRVHYIEGPLDQSAGWYQNLWVTARIQRTVCCM